MKYIQYINLPTIPEDLLESVEDIIYKPRSNSIVKQDFFQVRPVSQQLQDWLEKNLSFNFVVQYQVIYSGIPIHKDEGNRKLAYNYLLALGGNKVNTVIFDDDKKLLQSEILPLKTWHSIKTDMYHGVFGLQKDNTRVSLSVTPVNNGASGQI
jgi:hypothetical protein